MCNETPTIFNGENVFNQSWYYITGMMVVLVMIFKIFSFHFNQWINYWKVLQKQKRDRSGTEELAMTKKIL